MVFRQIRNLYCSLICHIGISDLNPPEADNEVDPDIDENGLKFSVDVTTILQQLVENELDKLASCIILSTNEVTYQKVKNTSQKLQEELLSTDKKHKRTSRHIFSRNLITNEPSTLNFLYCNKIEEQEDNDEIHGITHTGWLCK